MMEQGGGSWDFMPQSASRKDGEAGVRMQDQNDKEKAATSRPEPKPGRQHVQRPCDKNELSRPVEQTEASAARSRRRSGRVGVRTVTIRSECDEKLPEGLPGE